MPLTMGKSCLNMQSEGMTDKELMKGRFSRAAGTYGDNAVVQRGAAIRLASCLSSLLPEMRRPGRCGKVLEIGCGTGIFSRMLLSSFDPEEFILNDINEKYILSLEDLLVSGRVRFFPGDAESEEFPVRPDMIVSCSVFQWFHALPAFFSKSSSLLRDGGILAFSTFGKGNLSELEALEGMSLRYYSLKELEEMLEGNSDILFSDEYLQTLLFDDAVSVLRHLKSTGVTGIRKEFWTMGRLADFSRRYVERFSTEEGKLTLTYHPEIMVCRKRSH